MRYIIYARKSTESEDRQIQSIDDQINYLTALAKDRNLEIVKIFTESKSAKKPGRPVFDEMVKFIQDGKASGILTWKIDRLYRNPSDAGLVQWLLQEETIEEIMTSDRPYLPSDNALLLAIESGSANQYIRDLSNNVKRGIKSKLEKGVWPNYAPIGYKNRNGKIFIDKKTSQYILRGFELYAVGNISLKDLATKMYEEGFQSRTGNKYHKSKWHKILKNTFYYGVMYMHGKYYLGTHEPLITKKLYDQVQDVFTGKNRSKRKTHNFTYRGLMTCEKCGCMITAEIQKGIVYYHCTNGKGICDQRKKFLREEKVEKLLGSSLDKFNFDEEFIEIMYLADKEKRKSDKNYGQKAIDSLSNELKLITTKSDKLLDTYLSSSVSEAVYKRKEAELNKKEIDLQSQIATLKTNLEKKEATLEQLKNIFLTAHRAKKEFLKSKKSQKQKVLKTLLSNATLENQKIAYLSFKQPYNIIAEVEDLSDFEQLRRERDSNPRGP